VGRMCIPVEEKSVLLYILEKYPKVCCDAGWGEQ
jgi:hypothetical protein